MQEEYVPGEDWEAAPNTCQPMIARQRYVPADDWEAADQDGLQCRPSRLRCTLSLSRTGMSPYRRGTKG